MNRLLKILGIGLLGMMGALAQNPPPTVIPLGENALPIVGQISANYTGVGGQSQYCYFIVARYAIGNAQISASQCVSGVNPAGGGSIVVTWGQPNIPSGNAPNYSLSYDVIRLNTNVWPNGCNNCLLASATTSNTATDSLGVLSTGYATNTYQPGLLNYSVDNTSTGSAIAYDVTQSGTKRQADIRHGAALPTYCNVGDQFEVTGASSSLNVCYMANVWTAIAGGGGSGVGGTLCIGAGTNTVTCPGIPVPTSYGTSGTGYVSGIFIPANTTTAAFTININSLGALATKINGSNSSSTNVVNGGTPYAYSYDGTLIQIGAPVDSGVCVPFGTVGALLGVSSTGCGTVTAIPNGDTATTQSIGDNTTKIATDAFVIANAGSGTPGGGIYDIQLNNGSGGFSAAASSAFQWTTNHPGLVLNVTDPTATNNPTDAMGISYTCGYDKLVATIGFTDQNCFQLALNTGNFGQALYGSGTNAKTTWIADFVTMNAPASGQRILHNNSLNCYGMSDCANESTTVTFSGGPIAGDEGQGMTVVSRLQQPGSLNLTTTSGNVTRTSCNTTVTQNVTAGITVQTVTVAATTNCNVNDWVVIGQEAPTASPNETAMQITAVSAGVSISGIFSGNYSSGATVTPATVVPITSTSGFGQDMVLVDTSQSPYNTGTVSTINVGGGGVLVGSGTTWAYNMVGGTSPIAGCMALTGDNYNGSPYNSTGINGTLQSWYRINQITNGTRLVLLSSSVAGDSTYYSAYGTTGGAYNVYPCAKILRVSGSNAILETNTFTWTSGDTIIGAFNPYPDVTGFQYYFNVYTPGGTAGAADRGWYLVRNTGPTPIGGGFNLDNVQPSAVTIDSQGAGGYVSNDIVSLSCGAEYRLTVSGGVVTSLFPIAQGSGCTIGTNLATTGGTGMGLTLNVIWTYGGATYTYAYATGYTAGSTNIGFTVAKAFSGKAYEAWATTDSTGSQNVCYCFNSNNGLNGTGLFASYTGNSLTMKTNGGANVNTFPNATGTIALLGTNQTFTNTQTFSGILNVSGTFEIGGTAVGTNLVVASSPGVGIGHFAGSTQTITSSLIVNADITNATIGTAKLAAVQGSGDANVLLAGTVSGTGASLCTDSNGGATTTGCSGGGSSAWSSLTNPSTTLALTFAAADTSTFTYSAIGATTTPEMIYTNSSAATSGNQQFSPAIQLSGYGWKTNSTAASQQVIWNIDVEPVQDTVNPENVLMFSPSTNGTALAKFGICSVPTSLVANQGVELLLDGQSNSCNGNITGWAGIGSVNAGNVFGVFTNGSIRENFSNNGMGLASSSNLYWGIGANNAIIGDTGLARSSAGVLDVTTGTATNCGTTSDCGTLRAGGSIYVNAAPTVGASQIGFGSTTAALSNCGSAVLTTATACIVINVAGTTRYIPYF